MELDDVSSTTTLITCSILKSNSGCKRRRFVQKNVSEIYIISAFKENVKNGFFFTTIANIFREDTFMKR